MSELERAAGNSRRDPRIRLRRKILPPQEPLDDFEDLFESAPCGYLSLDASGVISKSNKTFSEWIGKSKSELAGKKFSDLLHIAGKIFYETHFAPMLRMQGFFNEVALEVTKWDGTTLPVLVNAVERRAESGDLLFTRVTVFNATDRRRYERELLDARAEAIDVTEKLRELNAALEAKIESAVADRMQAEELLRRSQKMEAIGQLTGGIAHDFNNLLTVIMGGIDTICRKAASLSDSDDVKRIRRAADMASHGARRAATLTARLLAFSRQQPLDPKPLEINRLLSGLADLLQRTLGETVELETVSAAGLWRAMADPAELENALINLAVNARDAMPSGGKLSIETENVSLSEDYVAGISEPVEAGQYVLIAVADTGEGMPPETVDRVFEPFFTTKAAGQGTGLGLSQVYGFVRQTRGHVRIYSEVGQGTTVKLYLPRAIAAAPNEDDVRHVQAASDGGSETILVVEDDEHLRSYATGALVELGYKVLAAADARSALNLVQSTEKLDLLFTDVVLSGGMNGRELAEEALRRRPGLTVLFTTGYTRNAIVHHGRLDPGVDLISKPFTFAGLAAKVRAVLDR